MDYVSGGLPAVQTAGKVIRAPSLKRGKNDDVPINERVKLERVLGLTVSSNAALDCDPTSELVAYPAGCTVVLFNPRKNRQSHLLNGSRKAITSLSFSADGRYIATGECGHLPSVRVWDLAAAASGDQSAAQIADFPGHKYGINCVAFSPNHKYVVSVGSQHDMIVNVWDWRGGVKVASNKVSAKVKAVSFAENGSYFVTVGNRHVKFWYLEYSRSSKYKEPVPLMGRSAILGEQRNNHFCDVACGRGEMADSTYAITKSGLLCEFNNRRLLDKWVELRTTSANCMAVGEHFIFIGCAEGIVRCFSPSTLQFVTTLPRTHYLGVDVAKGLSISHMASHPNNAKYPDVIAVTYDERNHKVTCVYNDHSLYVWDVRDIKRVGKSHSFLFHSACIWGVEMYPQLNGVSDFVGQGGGGKGGTAPLVPAMPPGSFVTCSSDDTIRVWNLDLGSSSSSPAVQNDSAYQKNIYSNELLKVVYVDPELTYLKDLDLSAAGSSEKSDTSYDGRNGVRSIRISPDGRHLASGDRAGNIRIHDLHSLDEVCRIEAHDAEVLCLEYTRPDSGYRFLASASRDRLIHVFSVDEEYNFLQTLDDHSSSITAVRFLNMHGQLQMVSCGADKSIIFRQLQSSGSPDNPWQFSRGHNVAGKTTLYDMEVDSGQKHVLTACQDRNIRVYNVGSGKHSKTFKGSVGEDGSLIKVVLDASGIYAATSSTDKTLSIYDYYSGECMATMWGHSELATGLRFTNDGRRLVSASGDGCLFVWRLPHDMAVTVHARLSQQAARAHGMRGSGPQAPHVPIIKRPLPMPNGHHLDNETFGAPPPDFLDPNANSIEEPDYRFSVGQLPLWAKKQIVEDVSPPTSLGSSSGIGGSVSGGGGSSSAGTSSSASSGRSGSGLGGSRQQVDFPKGRWAQRIDAGGITVKSVLENDSVIPFPVSQDKRDSDGSKDSSIDSGTEVRQYSSFRRETMVMSKRADGESPDFLPCPESYQELTNGEIPKQVQALSGKVTLTRGDLNELSRNRHLTDDSSIGSYRYEDLESTEHDGDVEDYSEGEGESTEPEHADQRLMYYPPAEDNPGSSDYTVNAMDVEELRRSQRRMKKPRPERLAISSAGGGQSAGGPGGLAAGNGGPGSKMSVPTISVSAATGSSVSGSQDSEEEELEEEEEEEDETAASTPSADASDRNLMSMLSMSTESLDHVGHREKFLKNTFESLSGGNEDGGEAGAERSSANSKGGSTSISSQFRGPAATGNSGEGSNPTSVGSTTSSSSSTLRNVAVINATRQVRHDSETLKKREELLRRLEETRRKLQSVGMQSSLKTSQSISDLSHIPEDSRKHGGSGAGGGIMSGRKDNYLGNEEAQCTSLPSNVPSPDITRRSGSTSPCPSGPPPSSISYPSFPLSSLGASDSTTNRSSSMAATAAEPTNSTNATSAGSSSSAANLGGNAFGRRGGRPSAALFLGLCPAPYRPPHHQQHHGSSGAHGASNHSLPESPVCEPIDSPLTFLTHRSSNKESCIERNSRKTRTLPPGSTWSLSRSCSYFIDLNTLFVKSESSPSICPTETATKDDDDEEDAGGNFSSDSLEREEEEDAETRHGIPRRCVSDYTICQREAMVTVSVAPSEGGGSSGDRRRRRSAGAASVGGSRETRQQRRPPLPPGRRRKPVSEADPDVNHLSEGGEGSACPSLGSRKHRPVFRTRSLQDTSSRRIGLGEDGTESRYEGFESHTEGSSAVHSPRNWSDNEQRWRFKYSPEDFGYHQYVQGEMGSGLPVSGSSTPSSCASPKHVAWKGSDGTSKQQYPLAKRVTLRQVLPCKSVFNHVSGKVPGKNSSSAGFRTLPRQTLKQTSNSSITRSSSVGVLNQSDSETDLTTVHRSGGRITNGLSSAMRPTISSQNKVNGVGGKSGGSSGSSARRRSLTSAFSSGNLNHVGNEDSSSEEAGPSGGKSSSGQQRPRSTSIDSNSAGTSPPTSSGGTIMQQQSGVRHSNATNRSTGAARSAGDRDLGRTAREVTQRLTQPSSGGTGGRRVNRKGGDADGPPIPAPRGPLMSPADENSMDPKNADAIGDIASAPLTLELCSSVVERLNRSADAVVHLHKRISLLEGGTTPQHQQSPVLLRTIEEGVVQAQETLRLICDPQTMSSTPLAHFPQMSEVNPKHRDFPSLPMIPTNLGAPGQGVDPGNPAVVQMMQQYSDMLLSLVQQRMGGSVPPPAQKQSQMAEGGSGQGSS